MHEYTWPSVVRIVVACCVSCVRYILLFSFIHSCSVPSDSLSVKLPNFSSIVKFLHFVWNKWSSSSSSSHKPAWAVASLVHDDRVQGPVSRGRQVSDWCRFGFGRSICHVGDQADDSRRDGEDNRLRGWRETVGLYVLGCCPAVWRCGQRQPCDDVGWRRWWQVDQWAQIFPSCERIGSKRLSGFCVGISYGMPPGTWHLLKWESMSRRHSIGRTGREQGKRVFWCKGVAGIGAEPTGVTGHLPRYFWKYRGKHVFMPRYFLVNNLLAIGDRSQLSPPIFTPIL